MSAPARGFGVLLPLVVCAAVVSACGKKGPPLAPLARVPAAPANPQSFRVGDEVYVTFTVPAANVSGQSPADLSAIDLYAVTATTAPSGPDLTRHATKIASYPVQPPAPPASAAGPPQAAPPPGFAQGATAVVRETLSPQTRQPDAPATTAVEPEPDVEPFGPLVAPAAESELRRYYFLVAVSPRGRQSAPTPVMSVPLAPGSPPPADLRLDYTESSMSLAWDPSGRAAPVPAADPSLLPSKPLVPPPPPTTYFVFEAPAGERPPPGPFSLTLPAPIGQEPVAITEFSIPGPVRFGERRCFVVRTVDMVSGVRVVGEASQPACVTPRDTFPPAPPRNLAAIAGVGVINLIWEPNTEPDLAGYLVLRGRAPGDSLQAVTPAPILETTYRDQSVEPGVRYIYAVVAVDNASPQNLSGQSNRVEESGRVP